MNTSYAPTASPTNLTVNSTDVAEEVDIGEGALWTGAGLLGCFILCYCIGKLEHCRERRNDRALQKWLASRHT